MEILIFRTDIKSKKKVKTIKPVLNSQDYIHKWTIDLQDIDNVLRIEAKNKITEQKVMNLIRNKGFYIEEMVD